MLKIINIFNCNIEVKNERIKKVCYNIIGIRWSGMWNYIWEVFLRINMCFIKIRVWFVKYFCFCYVRNRVDRGIIII